MIQAMIQTQSLWLLKKQVSEVISVIITFKKILITFFCDLINLKSVN